MPVTTYYTAGLSRLLGVICFDNISSILVRSISGGIWSPKGSGPKRRFTHHTFWWCSTLSNNSASSKSMRRATAVDAKTPLCHGARRVSRGCVLRLFATSRARTWHEACAPTTYRKRTMFARGALNDSLAESVTTRPAQRPGDRERRR